MSQASQASTHPHEEESRHWGQVGTSPPTLDFNKWKDRTTTTSHPNNTQRKNHRKNKKQSKTPSKTGKGSLLNFWRRTQPTELHQSSQSHSPRPPPEPPPLISRPSENPQSRLEPFPPRTTPTERPPPEPPPSPLMPQEDEMEDDDLPQGPTEAEMVASRRHAHGHQFSMEKPPGHSRIILQNTARFPTKANADRSTQFMENVKAHEPDALLLNDLSLNWMNLPLQDRWHERATAAGLPPHRARFSQNVHENNGQLVQWGGNRAGGHERIKAKNTRSNGL